LIDSIRENDSVSYDVEQGKKGLNAINVKIS
ncbi:MAG: cold-shock protein, partial [Pedobacter sp.]